MEEETDSRELGENRIFDGADTFTPLSDFLTMKFGLILSGVFGKIWNLSKETGYSYMSNKNIAEQLGLSESSTSRAIKQLLEIKLIKDVTEKYEESHKKKRNKWNKPFPFHKQVRFYQPNSKVLMRLKNG